MNEEQQWRLIDTQTGSAAWNMAVDEALLDGFCEGDRPILRLYGWENALSLGRFSNLDQTVNRKYLDENGISYVRRISGGGILVHGGDLSYALILPRNFSKEHGVKDVYRYWCRFLTRMYEKLGYAPRFVSETDQKVVKNAICLAGNEPFDITIGGKKMGGNAQRHTRRALLQHGTVPIRIDTALFDPLFADESGLERAASFENLGSSMEYEILSVKIQEAFCETYGVKLVSDTLSMSEEEHARGLMASKYTQERWNLYGEA